MCRPTVISNLKNGSHQLQVRTFDLVKRKRMKEHLQLKVKGNGRGMPLVCRGGGVATISDNKPQNGRATNYKFKDNSDLVKRKRIEGASAGRTLIQEDDVLVCLDGYVLFPWDTVIP
ncbi:hypothetical protein Cadr_000003351 [Camelus dromedarius]|uniref:Uncharacterized protein n=2 Tax=Camelus dromedarius TaxID=9838 RepID=A0A5N4C5H7_CAMDR|nr:hypothetical protein Cadr_000003351 [Camelus dromedarius]